VEELKEYQLPLHEWGTEGVSGTVINSKQLGKLETVPGGFYVLLCETFSSLPLFIDLYYPPLPPLNVSIQVP
jgi:hypothetical protein